MIKKISLLLLFCLSYSTQTIAQQPEKLTSVAIFHKIQKLNFLGSVLYVAAHPDDENTRLISYLANHQKARTAYLSLTRGDGGQNLIGTELRALLGVIRTQELIEARKIDGGEQFFTRANDFGYSKIPDETLKIWNQEQVKEDMIYVIRKFKPDVIINRFDHRSPGTTHGHHTSSAQLSIEIFDQINNKNIFPNQLKYVGLWQPKRLFFNTSWWFYGGKEKFDAADKRNLVNFETGIYYPLLGQSNQEIAALSRSRHQSQGFGSTGSRGEEIEYLELIKGPIPSDTQSIFEGIDTSWNRIKGGAAIGKLLAEVEKNFDFKNPSASIPALVSAYSEIQKLDEKHWKTIKSEELKTIIQACAGLYLEAVADQQSGTPGSTLTIKIEAINRSPIPLDLIGCTLLPEAKEIRKNIPLPNNRAATFETTIQIPQQIEYTEPYWLEKEGTIGMYRVDRQEQIGVPDIIRNLKVRFDIAYNTTVIPFEKEIIYKYNDPVLGEVYKPLDVVPQVTLAIIDKVKLFQAQQTQAVKVVVKAGKDNVQGIVKLNVPTHWKVNPEQIPFEITKKGAETQFDFQVTAPNDVEAIQAECVALVGGKIETKEQLIIAYNHIAPQQVLTNASSKFIRLDLKTNQEKIAYIMGAGDEVPSSLLQMGYTVTVLQPEEITPQNLKKFQVVIVGIRAYNSIEELAFKQAALFDFVKQGNTMIVQYNTTGKLTVKDLAPYPLKISRDRVTEEDAEVRFLAPEHKVLHFPNKITPQDFEGWVQEQGLYYPNEWSSQFTPILSSNDLGEEPKNGGLLIATYGKGHYIYTGLSFFRALPAGVPGAFRLLANLISSSTTPKP